MTYSQIDDAILKAGQRISQSLPDILIFKFWKLLAQLFTIRIEPHQFKNAPHSDTHSTNTWLAVHTGGIDGDAIKFHPCIPLIFLISRHGISTKAFP